MWLTRSGFTKALLDIIVLLTSTEILNHFQKFSLNFYPHICTNKLIIAFACSFKLNLPILYRICIQHHQNFCWYSKFWQSLDYHMYEWSKTVEIWTNNIRVTEPTRLEACGSICKAFIQRRDHKTSNVHAMANRYNTGKTKSNPRASVDLRSANDIQQGKAERELRYTSNSPSEVQTESVREGKGLIQETRARIKTRENRQGKTMTMTEGSPWVK